MNNIIPDLIWNLKKRAQFALLNVVSHQVLGKPLDESIIIMLCGGKLDAKGLGKLKELVEQDEAAEA